MQSHTVEDRLYRSVRCWPIWCAGREEFLVPNLGYEVKVDGVSFDTAPIKNGSVFSIMGISQNDMTVESGLHDPTDHLAPMGFLEDVYIRLGDQVYRHRLDLPYSFDKLGDYRTLHIKGPAEVSFTSAHRDINGAIISMLDPYTAAGLRIDMTIDLASSIRLETCDTHVGGAIRPGVHVQFPDYQALAEHEIRLGIHADLTEELKNADVLGFTINIARQNWLNPGLVLYRSSPVHNPEISAIALAGRYGSNS